ncbi:hypothetical protein HY041_02535, partial [Candidatus Roizmanbacteria bacterium]|nr:hypothetical protein [Candidatus Roizmanbacteria bacterium]
FNFKLNEKDLFVLSFGVFILVAQFLGFSVAPFRFDSLIVVFLFLLTTRSLVESIKFFPYLLIVVIGLLLSTFLSPYGLLIFYTVALILYKRTNLL